jgi:hypothetical protein
MLLLQARPIEEAISFGILLYSQNQQSVRGGANEFQR